MQAQAPPGRFGMHVEFLLQHFEHESLPGGTLPPKQGAVAGRHEVSHVHKPPITFGGQVKLPLQHVEHVSLGPTLKEGAHVSPGRIQIGIE
mmetsp:Transcript_25984/g.37269  ORF Transcript_25984/g.37269 Transcript_25984/m.37269 type:complete len:91 (+) Transcript_25984:400-672(+)